MKGQVINFRLGYGVTKPPVQDLSGYQRTDQRDQPSGYAGLDAAGKVPSRLLPTAAATPRYVFATQADMVAGGAPILTGEMVLVHADSDPLLDGEYVALQDAPTLLTHFDHLGSHVSAHKHNGNDIAVPGAGGAASTLPLALLLKQDTTDKGKVNGYASLDATGKVPPAQLKINAAIVEIDVLGNTTRLQIAEDAKYSLKSIPKGTVYTAADLRAMPVDQPYEFPQTLVNMNPDPTGAPNFIAMSDTGPAGIVHRGINLVNAVILRVSATVWRVVAEEWTGTLSQPTVEWVIDLAPLIPDATVLGLKDESSFTSLSWELNAEIGDITALGSASLVHKILELEIALHAASSRLNTLETAVAGVATHAHTDAVSEYTLECDHVGATFLMVKDVPAAHAGLDLFDGTVHKVDFEWVAGAKATSWYQGWLTASKPLVWFTDGGAHFIHLVDPSSDAPVTFQAVDHFINIHSVLSIQWNAAKTRMELLKIEHGTAHATP